MTRTRRPARLSDLEIVQLFLAIDPEISHIEIRDQWPNSKFSFLTPAGTITGVFIGHDDDSFDVRADDGNIVKVLKRSVNAVRRPPIAGTKSLDSEIVENKNKPGDVKSRKVSIHRPPSARTRASAKLHFTVQNGQFETSN